MRCLKGDTAFEPFSPARTEEDEPAHISERYAPAGRRADRLVRHGGSVGHRGAWAWCCSGRRRSAQWYHLAHVTSAIAEIDCRVLRAETPHEQAAQGAGAPRGWRCASNPQSAVQGSYSLNLLCLAYSSGFATGSIVEQGQIAEFDELRVQRTDNSEVLSIAFIHNLGAAHQNCAAARYVNQFIRIRKVAGF